MNFNSEKMYHIGLHPEQGAGYVLLTGDPGRVESIARRLDSPEPVAVDFWASWCGPCRMLAPVFEDLSDDYAGKVTFAKVNVDDNRELAKQYKIMSIPQLLLFKNGKLVNSMVGAQPREDIAAMLDSTL